METYDKQYFIKKFEAIPEEEIGTTSLDQKCALFHCGVTNKDGKYVATEESKALVALFGGEIDGYREGSSELSYGRHYSFVTRVNDGYWDNNRNKTTPKSRILAKLHSL